jgi:hypothetical protein
MAQVDDGFRRRGRTWRAGLVKGLIAWNDPPVWQTMSGQLRHIIQTIYFPESMCLGDVEADSQVYVWAEVVVGEREMMCPVVWEESGGSWIGFV